MDNCCDSYCKGCRHFCDAGEFKWCNYISNTGHRRPCPAGALCTVRELGRRKTTTRKTTKKEEKTMGRPKRSENELKNPQMAAELPTAPEAAAAGMPVKAFLALLTDLTPVMALNAELMMNGKVVTDIAAVSTERHGDKLTLRVTLC